MGAHSASIKRRSSSVYVAVTNLCGASILNDIWQLNMRNHTIRLQWSPRGADVFGTSARIAGVPLWCNPAWTSTYVTCMLLRKIRARSISVRFAAWSRWRPTNLAFTCVVTTAKSHSNAICATCHLLCTTSWRFIVASIPENVLISVRSVPRISHGPINWGVMSICIVLSAKIEHCRTNYRIKHLLCKCGLFIYNFYNYHEAGLGNSFTFKTQSKL